MIWIIFSCKKFIFCGWITNLFISLSSFFSPIFAIFDQNNDQNNEGIKKPLWRQYLLICYLWNFNDDPRSMSVNESFKPFREILWSWSQRQHRIWRNVLRILRIIVLNLYWKYTELTTDHKINMRRLTSDPCVQVSYINNLTILTTGG